MSSNKIELYCWILGNDPSKLSPVQIEKTQTIAYLRTAIKVEKKQALRHYDSGTLALWKFSMVKEEVLTRLAQINLDSLLDRHKLRPLHAISEVFPDPPEDGHLYLVVVQPDGKCGVFSWAMLPLMFHSAWLSNHDQPKSVYRIQARPCIIAIW
jgi:hypothetical protein